MLMQIKNIGNNEAILDINGFRTSLYPNGGTYELNSVPVSALETRDYSLKRICDELTTEIRKEIQEVREFKGFEPSDISESRKLKIVRKYVLIAKIKSLQKELSS